MRGVVSRLLAVAHKEVWHILRDPRVLGMALGLPVVLIVLYGNAVSFDLEHIAFHLCDQDDTQASRRLAQRFAASDAFRLAGRVGRAEDVPALFRSGEGKAVLVIPRGFERRLIRGGRLELQFLLDGSDNTTASQALGYAQVVAARFLMDMAPGLGDTAPGLDARIRVFFNPTLESSHYLVPGLMVVIMTLLGVILTALTVAREWEEGSMEMLLTTRAGAAEVLVGKLLPYFVLGLVQVLLVLTSGALLFDVPIRGSLVLLALGSSIFLLALLAQGLVISVVTRNQLLATLAASLSTMLPSLILSDFVFPTRNMPAILRWTALVLPPLHFVRFLRAVLLKGVGPDLVAPELGAMTAFFVFILGIAVLVYRRRLA